MHPRLRTEHVVYLSLLVLSLGAASYVAYRIVGFLGLGVLGLIIGVIALTVELERGGPIGDYYNATNLYAQHMAAVDRMSVAEKAERQAEIESTALPLQVAKLVSAALIVVGFGLFFAFDLGA